MIGKKKEDGSYEYEGPTEDNPHKGAYARAVKAEHEYAMKRWDEENARLIASLEDSEGDD
jgi:hypothetical protein